MLTVFPEELINDLKGILHENAGEEIGTKTAFQNIYIESETRETELMLRFLERLERITIARVVFENERQGSLKKVIATIEEFIKNSDTYKEMVFESVLNPVLEEYLLKNGYEELSYMPGSFVKQIKN